MRQFGHRSQGPDLEVSEISRTNYRKGSKHMRISVFFAGALVSAVAAMAQEAPVTPLIETGINYSFVRANPGGAYSAFSQNGGSGYIELNVNKVLGVVADFGGYYNGAINNFSVSN